MAASSTVASDYKSAKEAFVSNTSGSSILHINLVSTAAICTIALYSALRTRLNLRTIIPLPLAFLILVVPVLLSITLFALSPIYLIILLLIPTGILLLRLPAPVSPLPSAHPTSPASPSTPLLAPLPELTTYRAHMLLLTALAILAVDFPAFPRALAKCESFGVSLMDMGVGSFVFSQGLVSARPILKDPRYLHAPLGGKLLKTLRVSLPIAALGVIRVLLVKGTEYPEHVSEYGVHWNFFLTLAFLPILQVCLHPIIARMSVSFLGVLLAFAQQLSLFFGLQDYVLNAPRTSLISENKEGLTSLAGYLALHILGLAAGTLVLPPSPSFFRRQHRAKAIPRVDTPMTRQDEKTATELAGYAVMWWALTGLAHLFGAQVSRRLVNLPYILWVSAFNTTSILAYLAIDRAFYGPVSAGMERAPALLADINRGGLVFFLVANLATGAVNLVLPTMHMSDAAAMAVLTVYAIVVCSVAVMWSRRGR